MIINSLGYDFKRFQRKGPFIDPFAVKCIHRLALRKRCFAGIVSHKELVVLISEELISHENAVYYITHLDAAQSAYKDSIASDSTHSVMRDHNRLDRVITC